MKRTYPEESRARAVKQVVELGYAAKEVAERLGVSIKSLYAWLNINKPLYDRPIEDKRLFGLIRGSYLSSDRNYGSPRVQS